MGLRETKTPDIPTVPDAKGALARFIQAVTETLQVREGRRGDQLDQAVTYRDLVAGGIVTMRGIGQVGGRTGGLAFTPVAGGDDPDLTPPPLLTGMKVTPGLKTLFVQWDAPIYTQGHGPAHVEVWGAPYSGTGPLPTFGNATLLDRVQGVLYPHQVQHASAWHYWARNVTVDGVAQPTPTGGTNGVSATAGLDIDAALTDLTGQITESQLWSSLAARINLIDGPATLDGSVAARVLAEAQARGAAITSEATTRQEADNSLASQIVTLGAGVSGNAAAIVAEATARSGADSALASSISTVAATAAGNAVAIQTEATARADADGTLFAQYTVKIDANGRVAGFGLASEPSAAGGSTSSFIIRADKFAVGAPGVSDVVPFIVNTTPITEDGRTIPAGVYMDAAYIRNVSALIARFGDASIDNALIASLDAAKLTAGDGTIGGTLKSQNYIAGSIGWRIHRDGSCEFSNLIARGTVYATAGLIGGNSITADAVYSPAWITGGYGWRLGSDGNVKFVSSGGSRIFDLGASGTQPVLKIGSVLEILANGSAIYGGALASGVSLSAPVITGGSMSAGAIYGGTITGAELSGVTGAFVSAINLAGNAVNASNSASGTGGSVSTSISVPAGTTWKVLCLGFQDGWDETSMGGAYTLSLNGTSTALISITLNIGSDGTEYHTWVQAGAIATIATIAGPATFAPTLSGQPGRSKTIVLFGAPA